MNKAVYAASRSAVVELLEDRCLLSGNITGHFFKDVNSNGVNDQPGDTALTGWTVFLDTNSNNVFDGGETSTTTNGSGDYTFSNLADGSYKVREVVQSGFRKSLPIKGTQGYDVTIAGGNQTGKDFGNTTNVFLGGVVYNDANANGTKDAGEAALPNVEIKIISNGQTVGTRLTKADGTWQVQGLSSGSGSAELTLPGGFTATFPANAKYVGTASSGEQLGNLNFGLKASANPGGFTPGNIVVYRVGDGGTMVAGASAAVFLDEYSPTGTLVKSYPAPTSISGANQYLTASSTASSEGMMTLSTDGKFLVFTGYDAPVGTPSIATTPTVNPNAVLRTVGRAGTNGVIDTSTLTTSFSAGNIRGAASTNGTDIWLVGSKSGVRYVTAGSNGDGGAVSSTLANIRGIEIFGGQLYVSTGIAGAPIRIGKVGTGTPTTTGQTITNLPGFPTATGAPAQFYFADLNAGVAGVDTLYVANEDATALQKFSLVGGNWALNGTVGVNADDYRGLTGIASGGTVTLYATRKGGTGVNGGGQLVKLVDTAGYNANFSSTTPIVLATATAKTSFRGVAFAPGTTPSFAAPAPAAPAAPAAAPAAVASSGSIVVSTYSGSNFFSDSSDDLA